MTCDSDQKTNKSAIQQGSGSKNIHEVAMLIPWDIPQVSKYFYSNLLIIMQLPYGFKDISECVSILSHRSHA